MQSKRQFIAEETQSDVRFASDHNSEARALQLNTFEVRKRRHNKSLATKNLIFNPSLSHENQSMPNDGSIASSDLWRQLGGFASVGLKGEGALSVDSQ